MHLHDHEGISHVDTCTLSQCEGLGILASKYHSRQIPFENIRVSDTSPAIRPANPRTTTAQSVDGG